MEPGSYRVYLAEFDAEVDEAEAATGGDGPTGAAP